MLRDVTKSTVQSVIVDLFGSVWSISSIFAASEPGFWYDPSDLSTMFQDSAGTIPVTDVGQPVGLRLDKSGRGNHASQSTPGSRAIYASVPKGGRRNLLAYSEQFDNAVWAKGGATVGANVTPDPNGDLTADFLNENTSDVRHLVKRSSVLTAGGSFTLTVYAKAQNRSVVTLGAGNALSAATANFNLTGSGTVTQTYVNGAGYSINGTPSITSVGNGWYRCSISVTVGLASDFLIGASNSTTGLGIYGLVSYTGVVGNGIYIWGAQLEVGSTATNYQRVGSIYDITEAGVQTLYGLLYDGLDDFYVTPTITPGTDKVQVFAGVRKLSDAARGVLIEHSADINANNGTFTFEAPDANAVATYRVRSKGTAIATVSASGFVSPITSVVSMLNDVSGDTTTLRVNGAQAAQSVTDQGTGNYLAYPLYIGRRGGTSLPYNGYEFGLIVRFGPNLSTAQIASVEGWLNTRTGAY